MEFLKKDKKMHVYETLKLFVDMDICFGAYAMFLYNPTLCFCLL